MPITLETHTVGQRRELAAPHALDLTLPESCAVRDVLNAIVTRELAAYRDRQDARRLVHVLTDPEIAQGAATGAIRHGASEAQTEVDVDAAITTTLRAFTDHLYYVFLDGAQLTDLDQTVRVTDQSHLRFVRLVALVGG
jgi:hypothetical protein